MTISKRIREHAAEVVRNEIAYVRANGYTSWTAARGLEPMLDAILAIPDDPQEQAIRAAAMEEAAQAIDVCHFCECRLIEMDAPHCQDVCLDDTMDDDPPLLTDRIRALAPAPSGWVCVKSDDLESLLESILAREDEVKNQTWAWKMATRLRAALPEDTNG